MPKIITNINDLDLNGSYTYADYLMWHFQERLELIKGKIFKMSPAPNMRHQKISVNFTILLGKFLWGSPCSVFTAPFDVRLTKKKKDKEVTTVVQPDICVICDEKKLDERGCVGAPDLVIEILSPYTAKKDLNEKYNLYQENGVVEYWVVWPKDKMIEQFVLQESEYVSRGKYEVKDTLESVALKDFRLPLSEIFHSD